MKGKTAIVTGGGSGIGRASARRFAEAGVQVVIADIDIEAGRETVSMIEDQNGVAHFVETDVSDEASVKSMVEETIETYGAIHYAHNNAGISRGLESTTEMTEAGWDRVIDVNLKSVWLCMKHELPHLATQPQAAIVNTASIAGLLGYEGLSSYTASKHGVVGLTRTAALEYADRGVRVNAVCPGIIDTPLARDEEDFLEHAIAITPMDRAAEPREVGEPVVWLCSQEASFITGVALPIDGGQIAQ